MTGERYTVLRGFMAGGETYRRGDAYVADDPDKRVQLRTLMQHGLVAPEGEAKKGGGRGGGDGGQVPPVRGG